MWKAILVVMLSAVLVSARSSPAAAQYYTQQNLLSDGSTPGVQVDPNLVNAWGLAASPTSPWWISNNGTGTTTLYRVNTRITSFFSVPGANGQLGKPTGMVFNGGTGFVVTNSSGTSPARFILASEDGTIAAFRGNPLVVAVDNSARGAVYKGLAIASILTGDFLYATNFHAGTVEVYDNTFHQVVVPGAFTDPTLPSGYAPFGIQNLGGLIYVTYALQDADKHDDLAGQGHGYVNAFDAFGNLVRRVASKGQLDSPWGLAMAPADFGKFSGDLLVGNFGNGRIHAFDPRRLTATGEFQPRGPLHSSVNGSPIAIDGLWALAFGHGAPANGPTTTLFFAAGPDEETHGLFGTLVVGRSPE